MNQAKPINRRFSFSIANLLLLVIVIGLALALYESRKRLAKLELESEKLTLLARPLSTGDPEKTHLIALPTGDDFTHKWRIRIPKGARYFRGISAGPFLDDGTPMNPRLASADIPEGDGVVLTVRVRPKKLDPASLNNNTLIEFVVEQGVDPTAMDMLVDHKSYLGGELATAMLNADRMGARFGNPPKIEVETACPDEQQTFSLDESIPLLKLKLDGKSTILVWLDPQELVAKKMKQQGTGGIQPLPDKSEKLSGD